MYEPFGTKQRQQAIGEPLSPSRCDVICRLVARQARGHERLRLHAARAAGVAEIDGQPRALDRRTRPALGVREDEARVAFQEATALAADTGNAPMAAGTLEQKLESLSARPAAGSEQ